MFNLVDKPWGDDPEVDVVRAGDDLRATILEMSRDGANLRAWADALAELAQDRAADLGCTPEDYLLAAEWAGQIVRSEATQLSIDARIAAAVERATNTPSGRHAHLVSRCALHLSNTHRLRVALSKHARDADNARRVQILYETSVEMSEMLYALHVAGADDTALNQADRLRDWLHRTTGL